MQFHLHRFHFLLLAFGLIVYGCSPFRTLGHSTLYPQPRGVVNDYADLLKKREEKILTELIKQHEKSTSDQIAIVVTNSNMLHNKSLEDWSLGLAQYWGVGQKSKNNGSVLVLVADTREIRIQNANGITGRLTDLETKSIIDNAMIPEFKKQHYFDGLEKGLKEIISELSH